MDYKELEVWQRARAMVKEIHTISSQFPDSERFSLTQQINRAAISIPSNIAEGSGRFHQNDKIRFMYIARGSLFEMETQLYLALDLGYLSQNTLTNLEEEITSVKKLLNGFINYLKKDPQ
ncbi:MAG: four helix bundle protein [Cyclobacteriaceae bacterium]